MATAVILKRFHITPAADGWHLRTEGESDESSHRTKAKAIQRARELAKEQHAGEIVVHSRDGSVEDQIIYSEDLRRH